MPPGRRSTRSAGCWGCPIRAAPPSWPRPPRRPAATGRFPRAWMGDTGDFSFSGLKTAARRAVTAALGPAARRRRARWLEPARGRGGRAGLGVPGLRGRCPAPRAPSGRRPRSAPGPWSWAAASPPMACCATGSPPGLRAVGVPLVVPRPGLCTDNGAMIGAAGFRRFVAGERAGPGPGGRGRRTSSRPGTRHARRHRDHAPCPRDRCHRRRAGSTRSAHGAGLGPPGCGAGRALSPATRPAGQQEAEPEPSRRWRGAGGHHRGVRRRARAAGAGGRSGHRHPDRRPAAGRRPGHRGRGRHAAVPAPVGALRGHRRAAAGGGRHPRHAHGRAS